MNMKKDQLHKNNLENLSTLLQDLEKVSLSDISNVPQEKQHILVEKIESLQDELKSVVGLSMPNVVRPRSRP